MPTSGNGTAAGAVIKPSFSSSWPLGFHRIGIVADLCRASQRLRHQGERALRAGGRQTGRTDDRLDRAARTASIYLPAVSADAILSTAGSMYGAQPFTRFDGHTLGCDAKGIAFMPIPPGSGNYAGLLTVELPNTVSKGDKY
jgi:hypothetical protein